MLFDIFIVLKSLILIVPVLISVAFLTLLERKLLSIVGFRLGPNKVSLYGFLQPIGDAVKLANKQINSLYNFSFFFYYLSAFFMFFCSVILWFFLFSEPSPISFKFSFILFMLTLGVMSLNSMICGWSTFSKYSLIGSIRTVAQLISYESVLYLCFFFFFFFFFSYSFFNFHFYPIIFCYIIVPFCFYIWIPSFLAELNRTPYDFSEGESELVSGFNTEFGSNSFTFIFLSEYSNIIFFCCLSSFLFFYMYFNLFFFFFFFFVIWIRSVLPRYRFDKLMMLAWKFFIPFLTLMFMLILLFYF